MPDSPEHSQPTILVHISQDLEPIVPGFLANRRRDLVTIEACLKQSDFNTIRMMGHRMKGDGGGYGFDHISAIGDRLEQAAIAQDPAAVTAQVADLKDVLVKVDENNREVIINPGIHWGNDQRFQAKDFRVLGVPDDGTFADYISIDNQYVLPKPTHLSYQEAAALPLAGLTAFRALFKRASLQAGEKVLISGVGGGVALMGLQFALALGCEVYVTSGSSSKIQKAINLGAKGGYNYIDAAWGKKLLQDTGGVDVVLDSAGGSGFQQFVLTTKSGGRIVFYGGTHGKIEQLNPQPIFWKQLSLLGTTMGSDSDFTEMLSFVTCHQLGPIIDREFDFLIWLKP